MPQTFKPPSIQHHSFCTNAIPNIITIEIWGWFIFIFFHCFFFIAKREDEDYDEQVEEVLQDEVNILSFVNVKKALQKWGKVKWVCSVPQDENDVYILTKVSDVLHSVFSSYKEKVLPWFEQLLPLIVQLIVSVACFCIGCNPNPDSNRHQRNLCLVSQQAMGWQTMGSVHLRWHSRALQPFLIQVCRVLCTEDVAITGWFKPWGSAGRCLWRWCDGSVRRRKLPLILYRYEMTVFCSSPLGLFFSFNCCLSTRCYPFACWSHSCSWCPLQGECQRYRELYFCCWKGHAVPVRVCKPQPSPSPLAQLVATQWGQRRSSSHIRFSVWPNWKVDPK